MLIVNIIFSNYMLYMNHVFHHIETPPGLTPPRLLAGDWEGKILYVESQYLELRRTKMGGGRSRISYSGTEPNLPLRLSSLPIFCTFCKNPGKKKNSANVNGNDMSSKNSCISGF